ncbi:MAG: glycerol kinase GlpK [Longimicrobiales bacterium]
MSKQAVLALDQGTTGSTALVISEEGEVLSRAYSEFAQYFPKPGWVEHDATEIWEVTSSVARTAIGAATGARIEALGITNQRETIVVWDRATMKPVHRAIVWQDRRTSELCAELKAQGHEKEVREKTGLVLDPYFSGTKLRWLFENDPEIGKRAEAGELAVGTIDSWLIAKLTGGRVHATDPTNASRTLLYDLRNRGWDEGLLSLLGVPAAVLPEIRPSSGDFGTASGEAFGLELPIGGVAGDQQAALFGQGCHEAGSGKCTYGTGAFLLFNTGNEPVWSERGLLTTAACDENGGLGFALEGSIFIAGAAVQWLRDGLGILEDAAETEAMARSLDGNDGVYLVPAFVGLGAPYWRPDARGSITGLTRGTRRDHLVRAALEAMAYGTREVLRAMEADAHEKASELRVDGGATRNEWLLEFLAGILDLSIRRPSLIETTALGAAGLAGLHQGVWKSPAAFREAFSSGDVYQSDMTAEERTLLVKGWDRAVRGTLAVADG